LTIAFPTNTTYSISNLSLNVSSTATDIDTWIWSNNSFTTNHSFTPNTSIVWSKGQHTLHVGVNDTSGNFNSSSVTFAYNGTLPSIRFTAPPTPSSSSSTTDISIRINISITEDFLKKVSFAWNGTNETIFDKNSTTIIFNTTINITTFNFTFNNTEVALYDSSLELMYNFDNVSSIGENYSNLSGVVIKDLSPNKKDATTQTSMDWTNNGKYGGAWEFDGADDYIRVGSISLSTLTACAWINVNGGSGGVWGTANDENNFVRMRASVNSVSWEGGQAGSWLFDLSGNLNAGEWNFVCGQCGSDGAKLFVNGILIESHSSSYCLAPISLGRSYYISNLVYFNGTIDEFRVYNTQLSNETMKQLYYSNLRRYNSTNWEFSTNAPAYSNQSSLGNYILDMKGINEERIFKKINHTDYSLYVNHTINGTSTFQACVEDGFNKIICTELRTVNVSATSDTTPPDLTIDFPTNTTYSYSNLSLNVSSTATDIDTWVWSNNSFTTNHSFTPNTSIVWEDGQTVLSVGVNDTSGNFNSSSVTFVVDTTPPNISLYSPADGESQAEGTVNFQFNVTDATSKIDNCSLIVDGEIKSTSTNITKNIINTIQYSLNTAVYTWKINCTDSANNMNSSSSWSLTLVTVGRDTGGGGGGGGGGGTIPQPDLDKCEPGDYEKLCEDTDTIKFRKCTLGGWSSWSFEDCKFGEFCSNGTCIFCEENWQCTDWTPCSQVDKQTYENLAGITGAAIGTETVFDFLLDKITGIFDSKCEEQGQKICRFGKYIYECQKIATGDLIWKKVEKCIAGRICEGEGITGTIDESEGKCVCQKKNSCEIKGQRECRGRHIYECVETASGCLLWKRMKKCTGINRCDEGICVNKHCVDGIKNYDEEGVDCGGECLPCEKPGITEQAQNETKIENIVGIGYEFEVEINKGNKLAVTFEEKKNNKIKVKIEEIQTDYATEEKEAHTVKVEQIFDEKIIVSVESDRQVRDISLGDTEIFEFGVLIQTRTCTDINKCGTTIHKPIELKLCGETCEEDWTCTDWSSCENNEKRRECFDKNRCGTEENKPATLKSCGCYVDWICDWTECTKDSDGKYYAMPYNCRDLNSCGTQAGKPEKIPCYYNETINKTLPLECVPDWNCEDAGECEVVYGLKNLIEKNISSGTKERICEDLNGCENSKTFRVGCDVSVPIRAERTFWCNDEYVDIYELGSDRLVSRMRFQKIESLSEIEVADTKYSLKSMNLSRVDIGFIETEFKGYCAYCYDGIKNYDEEGVDCGGPNCPECIEEVKIIVYRKYILSEDNCLQKIYLIWAVDFDNLAADIIYLL